jgi:hypothetical protein
LGDDFDMFLVQKLGPLFSTARFARDAEHAEVFDFSFAVERSAKENNSAA